MRNEEVSFYSEGMKVKGILRLPDQRSEREPDAKRKRDSAQPQERAQPSTDDDI